MSAQETAAEADGKSMTFDDFPTWLAERVAELKAGGAEVVDVDRRYAYVKNCACGKVHPIRWAKGSSEPELMPHDFEAAVEKDGSEGADEGGLADAFAAERSDRMRWVQAEKRWYMCSRTQRPGFWSPEDREGARGEMADFLREADRNVTAKKVRDVLSLSQRRLASVPQEFDSDPWLLGVGNGVVDLRTGELHDPDPKLMMTKASPVAYDKDADCPIWKAHVDRSLQDPGSVRFLQLFAGMALVGEVRTHGFLFLHGDGRNGKGVIERTLIRVMGPQYAGSPTKELLLARRGKSKDYELAEIRGMRLVGIEELTSERVDTGLLKTLTGGDTVSSREIYRGRVQSPATASFMLVGNELPDTGGDTSIGLWDRLWPMAVPGRRPLPGVEGYVPDFEQVALPAEYPGILRWMVEGCLAWQEANYELALTPEMEVFREEYRQGEDVIQEWADAVGLILQAGTPMEDDADALEASSSKMEKSLTEWWEGTGRPGWRPSQKKLASWLRQHGCEPGGQKRVGGARERYWRGVRLPESAWKR